MKLHRKKKIPSLLNIAPLIDCVFLLLIFFLLTSSFIEEVGLEIELPESASAATVQDQEIIIYLAEDGAIEINGQSSSLETLQDDLIPYVARMDTQKAVLKADKDVKLELLIKVMDLTKAAGIKAINISALRSPGGTEDGKTIPAPETK